MFVHTLYYSDFVRLMTRQGVGPERKTVTPRLCVPLAGIAGISHKAGHGMSVFQVLNLDVTYQIVYNYFGRIFSHRNKYNLFLINCLG